MCSLHSASGCPAAVLGDGLPSWGWPAIFAGPVWWVLHGGNGLLLSGRGHTGCPWLALHGICPQVTSINFLGRAFFVSPQYCLLCHSEKWRRLPVLTLFSWQGHQTRQHPYWPLWPCQVGRLWLGGQTHLQWCGKEQDARGDSRLHCSRGLAVSQWRYFHAIWCKYAKMPLMAKGLCSVEFSWRFGRKPTHISHHSCIERHLTTLQEMGVI